MNTIITNSNKYKRDKSENAYAIAIDSSWGTGKTFFTDMFENYLLGYDGENIENQNVSYKVIRFDAWKSDFWNNAFEPFIVSVLENDMFQTDIDNQNAGVLLVNLIKSAGIIAKGIAKKKIEEYIDSDSLEEALKNTSEDFGNYLLRNPTVFSGYQEFKNEIEKFKDILGNAIDNNGKLIIIIDELDRCKPIFAIQLMEIIKHLFNIKGITFVFMLDIEQLSYSVKTVYGQGMDATGYLCRFFDYITRMPKADIKEYLERSLEDVLLYNDCNKKEHQEFIEFSYKICEYWNLSLRDIDTIICSYKIMLDSFLREYIILDAHFQYLFYLVLKYKDVNEFNAMFIKGNISENMRNISYHKFENMREPVGNINTNIENMEYKIITESEPNGLKTMQGDILTVLSVEADKIILRTKQYSSIKGTLSIEDDMSLNHLLFSPDIKKWEKIRKMKYGRYIHQQLEMFNFIETSQTYEETE